MYGDSLKTFGLLLGATLAFAGGILALEGLKPAFDFLTAYLVEDSLSVDNLFVFLLIFRYFKVRTHILFDMTSSCLTGLFVGLRPIIGATGAGRHLPELWYRGLDSSEGRLHLRWSCRNFGILAAFAGLQCLPLILLISIARRGG